MKNLQNILILLTLSVLLYACQKHLDVVPRGLDTPRLEKHFDGLFNRTELLTFANFRVSANVSAIAGFVEAPLYMGDDVFSNETQLSTATRSQYNAYKYSADIYLPDEEPVDWVAFYQHIFTYNVIINNVFDAEDKNDPGVMDKLKRHYAEARARRAFCHLWLLNIFGQPYNEATAATDPGVPLVIKDDVGATNFTRASVQECYDFIIKELEESIPDLAPTMNNRLRLSRLGAQYMLGITYFLKGDYANALTTLNEVKANLGNTTIPLRLYDYNVTMNTSPPTGWYNPALPHRGASGYPLQFDSEENIFVQQVTYSFTISRANLMVKDRVIELFGPNDQRRKMFFNKNQLNGAITLPGNMRNSPASQNWGPGLPNLYLMLAECKARANDLAGAKTDLETLRAKRMPAANAVIPSLNQDDMVKFILDERQREYAATGLRWFDMRRLWNDARYNNIDPVHPLDGTNYTITKERLTLKIPPYIKAFNPNMPDNP